MILGRHPGQSATENQSMPPQDSFPPPAAHGRNARIGLWFFGIYCVLYAGFMGLAAFSFTTLAQPVAGVNWAILYGMGLIVAALVLAVIYMFVCTRAGEHADTRDGEDAK
jgi:uncharacterized membrane protein (DUF485 family)